MSADPLSSPEDDAARSTAVKKIAKLAGLWAVPVAGIAVLCLLLGVPWWIVAGGIAVFLGIIVFEA